MKYQETDLRVVLKWLGRWDAKHKSGLYLPSDEGIVLYQEKDMYNALMDEGEQSILDSYFRNQNTPTNLYFGLGNNGGTPGIPAETATLASGVTEVSGTGYARILVNRNTTDFPTLGLDAGDYQVESVTKTFTGGAGGWTAADYLFLCTVASGTSGKLIATVALSASRTLLENDTLDVSCKIKLQ